MHRPPKRFPKHAQVRATSTDPWWLANLRQHPFTVGSLTVLTTGGLLLLIFFCHVGEMPEVDIATSTSVLAAVALIGLLVSVVFGGTAIAAGLIYQAADDENGLLRSRPSLLLAAVPGLLMIGLLVVQAVCDVSWLPASNNILMCALLGWIIADARVEHMVTTRQLEAVSTTPWKARVQHMGRVTLLSFHTLFLTLCTGLCAGFFIVMYPKSDNGLKLAFSLLAWSLLCCGTNLFIAAAGKRVEKKVLPPIGGALVLALLILTGNFSGIAVAAVRALGLGEIPVRLVVTAAGCDILNRSTLNRPVCQISPGQTSAVVCPVVLKSKIGTPFLVELSPFDGNGLWPNAVPPRPIQVSRTEVLSWPRIEPLKSSGENYRAGKPTGVVTFLDSKGFDSLQAVWLTTQCGESPPLVLSPASPASSARSSP